MLTALRTSVLSLLLLAGVVISARAQDGFAREATGGAGGRVVTVRTSSDFRGIVSLPGTCIVQVEGRLKIGEVNVSSNKTIVGIGHGATLVGNLKIEEGASNIIFRNLSITDPTIGDRKGGDGITIRGGVLVWIDQCTFYDCGDGCVDVTHASDKVTISWCKFYYTTQREHRFTMLAMGPEKNDKEARRKGKLRITLHHNWWADNCDERMPAMRNAKVHMYNNYFSCSGNSYCTNARPGTELLSEHNYYDHVKNPCYVEGGASLRTVDNIYDECEGKAEKRNDRVFSPPYNYSLDDARNVPDIVRRGAGSR